MLIASLYCNIYICSPLSEHIYIVFLKYLKVNFLEASTMCNVEAGSSTEEFCCQCMLPRLVVGLLPPVLKAGVSREDDRGRHLAYTSPYI